MERSFAIVTDSVADLPSSLYRAHDIRVVPLHVNIDGVDYRDGIDVGPIEYLDKMAAASALPITSQPSPADFASAYEGLIAEGFTRILSLHLAGSISGTVACAELMARQVMAAHPDVRIEVVDTVTASIGQGEVVLACALMAERGASLDEALAYVHATAGKIQFLFIPGTFDNLVKSGRVSKLVGAAAGLLNIKVVIKTCEDCHMEVAHKARGIKNAMKWAARALAERSRALGPLVYYSLQSNAGGLLDEFGRMLAATDFKGRLLSYAPIGPVIATHIGLGAIGVVSMPERLHDPALDGIGATLVRDFR